MLYKIPRFTDEMEAFIVEKLAVGKPLRKVVDQLIQRYPEKFSDVEDYDLEEVKTILYGRLRNRKYDKRYSSYQRIKNEQEEVQSVIADIDIADPIEQLRMCDHLYRQLLEAETDADIDKLRKEIPTLLKLMAHASKMVELVLPSGDDMFDWRDDDIPPVKVRPGK